MATRKKATDKAAETATASTSVGDVEEALRKGRRLPEGTRLSFKPGRPQISTMTAEAAETLPVGEDAPQAFDGTGATDPVGEGEAV